MACVCHEEVSIICHDSQKVDRQDRNFYLKRHRTAWLQWKETLLTLREVGSPRPEDSAAHDEEQIADRLNKEAFVLVTCANCYLHNAINLQETH